MAYRAVKHDPVPVQRHRQIACESRCWSSAAHPEARRADLSKTRTAKPVPDKNTKWTSMEVSWPDSPTYGTASWEFVVHWPNLRVLKGSLQGKEFLVNLPSHGQRQDDHVQHDETFINASLRVWNSEDAMLPKAQVPIKSQVNRNLGNHENHMVCSFQVSKFSTCFHRLISEGLQVCSCVPSSRLECGAITPQSGFKSSSLKSALVVARNVKTWTPLGSPCNKMTSESKQQWQTPFKRWNDGLGCANTFPQQPTPNKKAYQLSANHHSNGRCGKRRTMDSMKHDT